jgi:hypothetical protein
VKKFIILLSSCFCLNIANAQLSCDELAELTVSLEDLSGTLEGVEDYGVDSELDVTLGELTHSLTDVAKVEQDVKLTRWIEDLKMAWKEMDRDAFDSALDNVFVRLDEIGYRDCNE